MKTPRQLYLPKKFQAWRPGQGELIEQIASSPEKVFLLDAPTGTGKSLIGIGVHQSRVLSEESKEVLARLSGKSEREYEHRCIYVTRTKQLQEQILSEFPKARTMKGRNNFPCLKHENEYPQYTAEDCTGSDCDKRSDSTTNDCPYFAAKRLALRAPLAVLNTSYFLTEANGPGTFAGADLLIIDEVDSLENELLSHIQLRVTAKQLNRLGLELPKDPHSLQGWLSWADSVSVQLNEQINHIGSQLLLIDEDSWTDIEITMHKQANRLRSFREKLAMFVAEVNDSWIFSEEENDEETVWMFKPVRVREYAERYLWRHAKRFLGMSGTILNPEIMAEDLGVDDWDYTRTECPFPLDNRPIYYNPVVNLTQKSIMLELPALAQEVARIMERYPNDKILVHTTSFKIQSGLIARLRFKFPERLTWHDSQDRYSELEKFKRSLEPKVMFSPSFDRGVDLPDDLCRCIIICKVPYISLGDPQVKARMKMPGGERWYLLKAAQTVMQMSGRGVRGEMDHCDTYILDRQFGSLLSRMGSYFPQWWKDAIVRHEL